MSVAHIAAMSKSLQVPSPADNGWGPHLVHLIPSAAVGAGLVLTCGCAMGLARHLHAPALFIGAVAGAAVGHFAAAAWKQRD